MKKLDIRISFDEDCGYSVAVSDGNTDLETILECLSEDELDSLNIREIKEFLEEYL